MYYPITNASGGPPAGLRVLQFFLFTKKTTHPPKKKTLLVGSKLELTLEAGFFPPDGHLHSEWKPS